MKIGNNNFNLKNNKYIVSLLPCKIAKEYIKENHYAHGCHNAPSPCFGLFKKKKLIGCLMFATPCSEAVRSSIFGKNYKDRIIELHRLHIKDCTPKNTESWFIAQCLKKLKEIRPEKWAVISFSDLTENHEGIIYKATNAYRLGRTAKARFYLDEDGRLRHPRQNGVNITLEEAKKRKWIPVIREGKNRYLYLLPDNRKHKRELIKLSLWDLEKGIKKLREDK